MKRAVLVALLLAALLAPMASGNIYVGKTPQREFTLVMMGASFNGMKHPQTPLLEAVVGESLQFTVIVPAHAEPHTFHLHGHPWFRPDTSTTCADAVELSGPAGNLMPRCPGRVVDTVLVKPGEIDSFTVTAGGANDESGDWMYHCHMATHMAAGMWGILRVYPFGVKVSPVPGALDVRLDRLGAPVNDATFDADGSPAHAIEVGPGHYLVHAPADTGVLTARSPTLGESVYRSDGETPSLEVSHAHG